MKLNKTEMSVAEGHGWEKLPNGHRSKFHCGICEDKRCSLLIRLVPHQQDEYQCLDCFRFEYRDEIQNVRKSAS